MKGLWPAGIAAVALILAACADHQAPPPPAGTGSAAHGSLAECLKAHGAPEPIGPAAVSGPPAGVDPEIWDKAMKACSTLAPGPAGPK